MSYAGRVAVERALTRRTVREHHRHAASKRGYVTNLSPLQIRLFGFNETLTLDSDFALTQWMRWYNQTVGLVVDDVVLCHCDEEWVVYDVVTDSSLDRIGLYGKQGKDGAAGPPGPPGFSASRVSVPNEFTGLPAGVETTVTFVTPGQAHHLYAVVADQACRVRLYATAVQAAADKSRTEYYDPPQNAGCLLELVYPEPMTLVLSPTAMLVSQDPPFSEFFTGIIRPVSGGVVNITLDGYTIQP